MAGDFFNGNYQNLTFTIGRTDDSSRENATLTAYADGELVFSLDMKWDELAKEVTIPLNGALRLKIVLTCKGSGRNYTAYGMVNGFFE